MLAQSDNPQIFVPARLLATKILIYEKLGAPEPFIIIREDVN